MEAAELYLGAALDIGLLRYRCTQSTMLSILHITKPADFLLELFCADIRFDTAVAALSRISSTTSRASCKSNTDLTAWLATKYERVECAEKKYMSETRTAQSLQITTSQKRSDLGCPHILIKAY